MASRLLQLRASTKDSQVGARDETNQAEQQTGRGSGQLPSDKGSEEASIEARARMGKKATGVVIQAAAASLSPMTRLIIISVRPSAPQWGTQTCDCWPHLCCHVRGDALFLLY